MRHYIWLNPVVMAMYGEDQLRRAMERLGYVIVFCEQDHITNVKKQYRTAVFANGTCVLDMRCPAAADYVKECYADDASDEIVFPEIEPILIQASRELARTLTSAEDADLTVITPCEALKQQGMGTGLDHTKFLTWKEFSAEHELKMQRKDLGISPIPPGFFAEYGAEASCLSSRAEIDQFFQKKTYRQKRIAEMLICNQGCHNGNGV